jgi:hypothetical protein
MVRWLLMVFLIGIFAQNVQAQTELQRLAVTTMEAPRTVAVFPDHPDKAALIFESTLTNLRFDSQMDGIVQIRDESANGRYIVIIEPFTQIISVSAPGFIQERLRVGNPQPREVRYFNVAPEERRSDVISVIFNVSPADARLFVDDQQTDINQTVQIEPGQRTVRIEREGYRTTQQDIAVSTSNISFSYSLEQIDIVAVQIRSNVAGASVTIDGSERGEIDRSGTRALFLYPDTYSLQLSRHGYVTRTIPIDVVEDGANTFTVDLTRNIGELTLRVSPSNARVLLNREDYSGQPLIELAPGRYRLDVEREFYEPYSETVDIALDQRLSREISLEAHTGTLQFSVSPNDAQVELIDASGRAVNRWTGIQILRNVQAGSYTIKATAEGHLPKEERVNILHNQTTQLSLELLEVNAIFQSNKVESAQQLVTTKPNAERLSWLFSADLLRLPSDSFKRNYDNPYMLGGSVGILQPIGSNSFARIALGGVTTKTSSENVIYPSGNLWYLYSQPAIGLRKGIWLAEAMATFGLFRIRDDGDNEVRQQSFMYTGVGGGVSFTNGLEVTLNYSLYSAPEMNSTIGIRLSWRLQR